MEEKNYFKSIIGEQLSSVEFVQDYLQLHFDGNDITFYSWPVVNIERIEYQHNGIDYKNKLCDLIGKEVEYVLFIEEIEFNVLFVNGAKIVLSLIRNDLNKELIEFLHYKGVNNDWLVLD
jgi:hypothetical protein